MRQVFVGVSVKGLKFLQEEIMSWVRSALIIGMTLFPSTALLVAIPGEGLAQQRAKGVRVQGHAARNSGKRLALVIGNAGYKSAPLRNPVNDARAMTVTLRGLGFEVIALENANQSHMKRAIDEFGKKLRQQGVLGCSIIPVIGCRSRDATT